MGKGGGSSVPKTPDLSGNVKTANAISGTATDQASQTFNTAKAYNQNAQNNLSTVVGAQTPVMQKLMFKVQLKDDAKTLLEVGVKEGAKVMLVGSTVEDVVSGRSLFQNVQV